MNTNTFRFEHIGDLVNARDLEAAGFLRGSKSAIYDFLNRPDVPVVVIGRRKFITKKALMEYFEKNALA